MKIKQQEGFQPVIFTIETKEEAEAIWDVVRYAETPKPLSGTAKAMMARLNDFFTNEMHR